MSENDKNNNKLDNQKSQQELLLDKIRHILHKTNPEYWKKGGAPLDEDERFEKPRQNWEEVYCLDIPTGVLVLRRSTPLRSQFAGRGFQLFYNDIPRYTTEIRAAGWHHTELTDPYKRSQNSDRTKTILAEGEIGKDIYYYVENVYNGHFGKLQSDFDKKTYELVCSLPLRLKKETLDNWERVEDDDGEIHYISVIDEFKVDVSIIRLDGRDKYKVKVSKKQLKTSIDNQGIAEELFKSVEELGQTSRLMTLTRSLEQI